MCSRLALGTVLLAVFSGCATEATIATPPTAVIALSSGTLDFSAAQGGANPAGQSITISNSAAGPLSGLAIGPIEYGPGAAAWLAGPSLNATGGAATLEVHAITGSLTPGTYTATISIGATGASNGPQRLTVRLSVGIGPDGGTIASADGRIALAVPAGALTDTANIRIATSADPPPSAAPEGVKALLGSWALSPSGLVLNAPVKLTISYANVLGQVPSSDSIGVLHWDSAGSFIDAVSASDDRTSKSLTFSISHFSNVSLAHTGGTFSLLQVKWATSTIRTSVAVPYSQAVFDDWQFATSGIEFVPASASAANIVIHDRADHFFCDSPGRAALLLDQFISTCLPSLTRALTAADVVHIFSPYPGSPPAATISTLQHAIGHAIGIGHPWRLPPGAAGSPLTNPPAWPVMQAQLLPLSGPQFSRTGLHPLDVDAIQAKYGPVLAPSISGVAPTSLLTSPAPQILTLAGLWFVPGTSITVTPPGQSPTLIGASQVTFVSRQSLRFSVALGIPGNWNLLATSPSGQNSNVLAMPVAAAPAALGAIAGSVTSPQIGALLLGPEFS